MIEGLYRLYRGCIKVLKGFSMGSIGALCGFYRGRGYTGSIGRGYIVFRVKGFYKGSI